MAIGAYEFSSFNQIGNLNLGSINSISAVPGVEIRIPMVLVGLVIPPMQTCPVNVSSESELGIAMSKQVGSFNLWKLKLDRIGLAYRFGADGKFYGVGIVFKSLFDR